VTSHPPQQTLAGPVTLQGVAFFSAADVLLRIHPAAAGHGIAFRRADLPDADPIPATIEFAVDRHRRTAISNAALFGGEAPTVELTEHVLAALAGLGVDNALVEVDGPELPGFDGSAMPIVEALLAAGLVAQDAPRDLFVVEETICVTSADRTSQVILEPADRFEIVYDLDYGPRAPFAPQSLTVAVTPDSFVRDLAAARTFVLESEVVALRDLGYGARTTAGDLVVLRPDGSVLDNALRWPDECVRHKILDCIGDLALLGMPLRGRLHATRSGHQLNRDLVRKLVLWEPSIAAPTRGAHAVRRAA
jgi:UDP-3-O-acyl N-acetylglucosamine deacetylase